MFADAARKTIVVVGNGMVGHKFLDLLIRRGAAQQYRLVTFCEEPQLAYDRVNLSSYFSGKTATDLSLVPPGLYEDNGVEVHVGDRAHANNRTQRHSLTCQMHFQHQRHHHLPKLFLTIISPP